MKRRIIFLTALLISALNAVAQTDIISQCENIKGVTTISISKAMLKMAGPLIDDNDISSLTSKLEHIDIIETESNIAAKSIQKIIDGDATVAGSENFVKVNDQGEKVTIKYNATNSGINTYYILTQSDKEYTVIIITGTMTIDDITTYAIKK